MQENTQHFFDRIDKALNKKSPFVAYRKPQENTVKAIFQKDTVLHELKKFTEKGFVFAPFQDNGKTVFIPCDTVFSLEYFEKVSLDNEQVKTSKDGFTFKDEIFHQELVKKGIEGIQNKDFSKVVLSRKETVEVPGFDVVKTFKKLLSAYKSAFVYVWFHPKIGLWLGATPETLLKIEGESFKTMALAGTQLYKGSLDVVWGEKEKMEQQFVTDYILSNLEGLDSVINISETETVKAGGLLHLRTKISGKLAFKYSISELIEALHPTPAVCGLPKENAKDFILKEENYNRSYYTGFLGELNFEGTSSNHCSELFVNLRCMQVVRNEVSIYVGGGVTKESHPEKEWEETVAKSRVMKKVL